ncbi:hypothetical protein [Dactylosporangium sp. NPDC048998]|uniref:hypothetical protein n=1 Tax=Dactylosporangium sp. NPDC048998 TaxID=3363976 RepID=UPI00371628AB
MRIRVLAATGAAMIALAGCSGGTGSRPTAAPAPDNREKLADAARCMRANGFPDYPDPVETGGRWTFPPGATAMAPKPAPECTDLFRQAGTLPRESHRAVTAQEITKLRRWAGCIRANGLPDWPDPDDEGIFHPKPAMPAEDDPRWQRADTACRSLEPGPISVDAGPGATKGR